MCQARSLAGVAFPILAWAAPVRSQDAFSSAQRAPVSPRSGWTFVAADMSGDSRSDRIGYLPSRGPSRSAPWWASSFSFAQCAAVTPASGWRFTPGDFTGDGRTDLLGYHPSNGTLWGGVSSGTSFQFVHWKGVTPAAGWFFAAGDFAGDARNLVRAFRRWTGETPSAWRVRAASRAD